MSIISLRPGVTPDLSFTVELLGVLKTDEMQSVSPQQSTKKLTYCDT